MTGPSLGAIPPVDPDLAGQAAGLLTHAADPQRDLDSWATLLHETDGGVGVRVLVNQAEDLR